MALKKKPPSLAALTDPYATDEQFVAAGDTLGPNALGASQWQQHSNAQRDQKFDDDFQSQYNTDPNWDPLNMRMHEAMRSNAQAKAIDPSGVMGMFTSHSNGAFPDEAPKKKKAASLAALGQVI